MTRHYCAYTQIAHVTLLDTHLASSNQRVAAYFNNSVYEDDVKPSIETITSRTNIRFFFNDPTDLSPLASSHRLFDMK